MKNLPIILVGSLCLWAFLALPGRAGAQPAPATVVLPGTPPLTFQDVANHVRLIEFVLGHRSTRAQQDEFLQAVGKTARSKDPKARESLVQARELIQSMACMGERERETVARLLREDFAATAREDQADPAAKLFLDIDTSSTQPAIGSGTGSMSGQALAAFLEFVPWGGPGTRPASLTSAQKKQARDGLTRLWPRLAPPAREALAAFDQFWYLWRAVPVGVETGARNPGRPDLTPAGLESLIRPDLWRKVASDAAALGESPTGWPARPSKIVW